MRREFAQVRGTASQIVARENIFDQRCACCRPIALPKLESVHAIVGAKKERSVNINKAAKRRPNGILWTRGDVLDQNRPRIGSIGLPQLVANDTVVSDKEHFVTDSRE